MLGQVFDRFVEKSPISVMVRAALERVLGADRLDQWYERTAQKQYTRALFFSHAITGSKCESGSAATRARRDRAAAHKRGC